MADQILVAKLDPGLLRLLREQPDENQPVAVMIRTPDGLKDEDREAVEKVGGKVKSDLYIVESFSAEVTVSAIRQLVNNPRFLRFYHDAPVKHLQEDP